MHPEPIYKFLWGLGVITAFLTPLYTFRLFFIVFLRRPDEPERDFSPFPKWMAGLLWPLAILSVVAGALNLPSDLSRHPWLASYLSAVSGTVTSLPASPGLEASMEFGTGVLALLSLVLAYFLYRPQNQLGRAKPGTFRHRLGDVLFAGFYLDHLYQSAVARPYQVISRVLWEKVDEGGIDAAVDQSANVFPLFSIGLRLWTTGRISTYLRMIFLGFTAILVAIVLGWYSW